MQNISIIVAIDSHYGIGLNNQLLCYLPDDLKKFKQITTGHTIIMGRKTYESLPNGALPNRRNIVISSNQELNLPSCEIATSIENAIQLCKNESEIFIIGGASIYQQAIDIANTIYLTRIHYHFQADTFFPKFKNENWLKKSEEFHSKDDKHSVDFSFEKWVKKSS